MVNQELFDLFNTDSMEKQLRIEFDGGVITNEELHAQSFELTESLCSEKNLRFGCCEASSIKFKISNIFIPLKDKCLTVTMTLNGDPAKKMTIGKYKVYSDVPTADRLFRDVVAYDSMYEIINTDVSAWYNGLTFPMTIRAFRASFVAHFGLTEETAELVNDGMTVEKTVEPSEMSGKDVITSICELNGVFGHIGRDGKFKYIDIAKYVGGLYPAEDLFPDGVPDYLSQGNNEHLYPQGEGASSNRVTRCKNYISCQYEDYIVKDITKLQIREKDGDIGVIEGDGDNTYVIQDNFLVYGKSSDELHPIAERLFIKIRGAIYRPFKADVKGCPCFEVGDYVQLYTKREIVSSYILKRTLKGIQALRDDFSADGEEEQPEKVNDIHTSIVQLKGKSNVLERTIEETKSTITDVEAGLQSQITQTATEIRAEVSSTAEGLSSRITQNADNISSEVTRATGAESSLSSKITQTAEGIESKVSKDSVISSINQSAEEIKIDANKVTLTGFVTMEDLSTSGRTTINGANVTTGYISCDRLSGGVINGQTIDGGKISGADILAGSTSGNAANVYIGGDNGNIIFRKGVTRKSAISSSVLDTFAVSADVGIVFSRDPDSVSYATNYGTFYCEYPVLGISGIEGSSIRSTNGKFYAGPRAYGGPEPYEDDDYEIIFFNNESATSQTLYVGNEDCPLVLRGSKISSSVSFSSLSTDTLSSTGKISAGGHIEANGAVYGNNIHANGGHYYATAPTDGGGDGAEYGILELENSKYTKDNVQHSVFSCCVGCSRYPTVLRGTEVRLKDAGGAVVSSDERIKNSFKPLEEFRDVYMDIEPCAFKYNNGTSGRYHFGFKAQDVENALLKHGYTTKDFAGFVQSFDKDGSDGYCGIDDPKGLIYTEFVAWNTHMIQSHEREKKSLELRISELENKLSSLTERMENYEQSAH